MKIIITPLEELEELVKTSVAKSIKAFYKEKSENEIKTENLTVKETAIHLSVSEITIRNYIKKGTIPAKRIGNRILINRAKLESILKEVKSLKYKR